MLRQISLINQQFAKVTLLRIPWGRQVVEWSVKWAGGMLNTHGPDNFSRSDPKPYIEVTNPHLWT